MPLKPYLQLVRLPNVFTAAADSLAGWLLVEGTFHRPARWAPLVGASMAIYAAGIALNDYFDLEIDRAERPGRPLPSGRISPRFAALLGWGLLAVGLASAAASGSAASLGIAAALAACVVAYDAGLKRTPLGPVAMGACRGLNLLLGMSQAPHFGGPSAWLVAAAIALFVAGLTWISRSESGGGGVAGIALGIAIQLAGFVILIHQARAGEFPRPSLDLSLPSLLTPTAGLVVLVATVWVVTLADVRAALDPRPATVQRAVKTGVFSLVWLNVGVVAAVRGPEPALAVAACWLPAYALGKWLYAT